MNVLAPPGGRPAAPSAPSPDPALAPRAASAPAAAEGAAPAPVTARAVPPKDEAADDLIVVRGLKKYFPIRGGLTSRTVGFVRAVDGVDLRIKRGKTLGLIGESGCGKTTVGRCILRLIEPTLGTVTFNGNDLARTPRSRILTAAGGLLVTAVVANVFILLLAVLGRGLSQAYGIPDIVVLLVGAIAPGSTAGIASSFAAAGLPDYWIPLALVGIFTSAFAAGACFEAHRARPTVVWVLVALLSFQIVLAGAALALVLLARRDFGKDTARAIRKDMQIVFQDPFGSLNPRMLVSRVVSEPLRAFRGEIADRYPGRVGQGEKRLSEEAMGAITADLIARVGLNPEHLNRFPHEFSGGQRQRICVARALALKPAFIVLDEPTSALDVSVQAQILNLLKELQRERELTYLFISHHLAVIRHMCDDIAVMYLGKIVEKAQNEALFLSPMHPYTIALLSAIPSVDPEMRRERIVLEGEIPSPANPPEGCRFHTRCNFAVERETRVVEVAFRGGKSDVLVVEDPLAVPSTVRLVFEGKVVDPFAQKGGVAYEIVEVPGEGIEVLVRDGRARSASVRVQYRRYREPCATQEPALLEVQGGHAVACHFWQEAVEAGQRAAAEGRPIGAVVSEMRAPLEPPSAPRAA